MDELSGEINDPPTDELAALQPAVESPVDNTRTINLILDHSAFVRGIGNIKRWFNLDYIKSNLIKDEKVALNIYIPSYTLHEFDFAKRGTSMMATNARQAIRFIDTMFEEESQSIDASNPITYGVFIESPDEAGPSWNQCSTYKIHSPLIKEFPNFKTKFDSNVITEYDSNDIVYENSHNYQNALANSDNLAEMPNRLKYLIRSCIHKNFIEKGSWSLVTEDPITKVWSKSFGINCLNVNDAELLIFKNYNINQFNNSNPHNLLEDGYDISKNILTSTIDTTKYNYQSINDTKDKYKNKKGKKSDNKKDNKNKKINQRQQTNEKFNGRLPLDSNYYNPRISTNNYINGERNNRFGPKVDINASPFMEYTDSNGDLQKKERFGVINFAPRGNGELWKK